MNHGEEKIVLASVAFVVSTFDFNIDCCFSFNFFSNLETRMDHICIFAMNNIWFNILIIKTIEHGLKSNKNGVLYQGKTFLHYSSLAVICCNLKGGKLIIIIY